MPPTKLMIITALSLTILMALICAIHFENIRKAETDFREKVLLPLDPLRRAIEQRDAPVNTVDIVANYKSILEVINKNRKTEIYISKGSILIIDPLTDYFYYTLTPGVLRYSVNKNNKTLNLDSFKKNKIIL